MIYLKTIKKYKFLIFIVVAFLLGFLTAPLFHSGYIPEFMNSFKVRWYIHILLILGLFLLTLALHELAHFMSFMTSGYKNDVIIILFMIFFKKEGKWKFKIDFKLLMLGGGLVMPDLGIINNDEDFNKARKAMQKSLLVAPLFTLISGVLLFLITAIFFYKDSILVPISVYTLIFSLLYSYLSSKESNVVLGDFKAYKRVKNDDLFAKQIMLQYMPELSDYYRAFIVDYLANTKSTTSREVVQFYSILLDEAIYESKTVDMLIYNWVMTFVERPTRYKRFCQTTEYIDIAQAILFYLDKLNFKEDLTKLTHIFLTELDKTKTDEKSKEYVKKQTEHVLGIADNNEFITNSKNMYRGFISYIFKNIPSFLEQEQIRNEGYPKFNLTCDI